MTEIQLMLATELAAEHIRNHPNNIASATQSLLMYAKNCIAAGGGHFEQLL